MGQSLLSRYVKMVKDGGIDNVNAVVYVPPADAFSQVIKGRGHRGRVVESRAFTINMRVQACERLVRSVSRWK